MNFTFHLVLLGLLFVTDTAVAQSSQRTVLTSQTVQKSTKSTLRTTSETRLATDSQLFQNTNKIELQLVSAQYVYQEPGWMEISGLLTGFRLGAKQFVTESRTNFWGANFEYLFGGPDYNGKLMDGRPAQGPSNDEIYNTQFILGYASNSNSKYATQYAIHLGLGYRYLNNYVQMTSGYEREQRYFYSPIYLSINKVVHPRWRLSAGFEFDHLWSAQNTAHYGDADPQLQSVKMPQESGMGYELSLTAEYRLDQSLVFIQIFNRTWQVQKSQVVAARKKNGEIFTSYEPKNNTTMTGLGLGLSF